MASTFYFTTVIWLFLSKRGARAAQPAHISGTSPVCIKRLTYKESQYWRNNIEGLINRCVWSFEIPSQITAGIEKFDI